MPMSMDDDIREEVIPGKGNRCEKLCERRYHRDGRERSRAREVSMGTEPGVWNRPGEEGNQSLTYDIFIHIYQNTENKGVSKQPATKPEWALFYLKNGRY